MKKIICVEGISGSGKSNLSQYLSLQFIQNKIANRWFSEFDFDNPIYIPNDYTNMIEESKKSWLNFVHKRDQEIQYVLDGRLLLLNTEFSLKCGKSVQKIKSEMADFLNANDLLENISLIYLNTELVSELFMNTSKSRNADDWYIDSIEKSKCTVELSGSKMEKVYSYYKLVNDIMFELYQSLDCEKYIADITGLNWNKEYNGVLNHIGMTKKELVKTKSIKEYFGDYCDGENHYTIIMREDKPFAINHPYNNFKPVEQEWELIPVEKDRLVARGSPIMFDFERNEFDEIVKLLECGYYMKTTFSGGQKRQFIKNKS